MAVHIHIHVVPWWIQHLSYWARLIPPPIIAHIYQLFAPETAYDSHNVLADYYLIG